MPDVLEAALSYATELGWYIVPVHGIRDDGGCTCKLGLSCGRASGKHPLTSHGVHDSTTDPEVIKEWYRQWPYAGIGVDLERSNLLLLGPDSTEWQQKFEDKGLHAGAAIADSGGGDGHLHYYLKRPQDAPITTVARSGEFDLKTNGIGILPPSKHYSGRMRTWLTPPSKFLPPASDLVLEIFKRSQETSIAVTPLPEDVRGLPPVRLTDSGMEWWQGLRVSYKPGSRIVDESETIFGMGMALAEAGASEWLIRETLAEWAPRWGYRKYIDRPFEYERVAIKVCEFMRMGVVNGKPTERKRIIETGWQLLQAEIPSIDFIVEGILPATGLAELAAEAGSFKTWMAIDLAMKVVRGGGGTWMTCDVSKEGRVLYLNCEISRSEFKRRLHGFEGDERDDNIHIVNDAWRIEDDLDLNELRAILNEGDYKLVIVDSFSKTHGMAYPESDPDAMNEVLGRRFRQVANDFNVLILFIHHFNKGGGQGRPLHERGRGTFAIRDNMDSILLVRRKGRGKESYSLVSHDKLWQGAEMEGAIKVEVLDLDEDRDGMKSISYERVEDEEEGGLQTFETKKLSKGEIANNILGIMLSNSTPGTQWEFNKLMRDLEKGAEVGEPTARKALENAISSGTLIDSGRQGVGGKRIITKS